MGTRIWMVMTMRSGWVMGLYSLVNINYFYFFYMGGDKDRNCPKQK